MTSLNLRIRRSSFQFMKKLRHRETEKVSQQPKDHAKLLQSCPALWDPVDCSTPGSSVLGILQARILEWVAVPSSRGSSSPRDQTCIMYPALAGRYFTTSATWEAQGQESNLKPGLLVPKLDSLSTEPHQVLRWRKVLDILQAPSEHLPRVQAQWGSEGVWDS